MLSMYASSGNSPAKMYSSCVVSEATPTTTDSRADDVSIASWHITDEVCRRTMHTFSRRRSVPFRRLMTCRMGSTLPTASPNVTFIPDETVVTGGVTRPIASTTRPGELARTTRKLSPPSSSIMSPHGVEAATIAMDCSRRAVKSSVRSTVPPSSVETDSRASTTTASCAGSTSTLSESSRTPSASHAWSSSSREPRSSFTHSGPNREASSATTAFSYPGGVPGC
mmetsp:Transcript_23370/g.65635  ORF Transcript_23370/g.65635 Transcript_23370/m.65635 type:complete len:225 (+) Transcript_23370:522-1196(+)